MDFGKEHGNASSLYCLLDHYLKELITEEDHFCPCTHEEFSVDNPPYKPDGCYHRISRTALRNLDIYRINRFFGTAYQICPVCRSRIHFACLDVSYLLLINLSKDLRAALNGREGNIQSIGEDLPKAGLNTLRISPNNISTHFPKFIEPKGGILGCLNFLASQSE